MSKEHPDFSIDPNSIHPDFSLSDEEWADLIEDARREMHFDEFSKTSQYHELVAHIRERGLSDFEYRLDFLNGILMGNLKEAAIVDELVGWMRTQNEQLGGETPLDILSQGSDEQMFSALFESAARNVPPSERKWGIKTTDSFRENFKKMLDQE